MHVRETQPREHLPIEMSLNVDGKHDWELARGQDGAEHPIRGQSCVNTHKSESAPGAH